VKTVAIIVGYVILSAFAPCMLQEANANNQHSYDMPFAAKKLPDLTLQDQESFLSRIEIKNSDECWLWTGARHSSGYGYFKYKGKGYFAHRVAFEMTHGEIDVKLSVCHDCPGGDRPLCCNPDHLFSGTHSDNMRDKISKGRGNMPSGDDHYLRIHPEKALRGDDHWTRRHPDKVARGENHSATMKLHAVRGCSHPNSKLTETQVLEIRRLKSLTGLSHKQIGEMFGVGKSAIKQVVSRRTWGHI
jgi:hypothetical protein